MMDGVPRDVLAAVPGFRQRKSERVEAWAGELPWGHLLEAALAVARDL